MRRPTSSSSINPVHLRSMMMQPPGYSSNTEDQRESTSPAITSRRLTRRGAQRRMISDNFIFNPLRRPRDRLYHELAERHRARARAMTHSEPRFQKEEKQIQVVVLETDGGSYQSSTSVRNVCNDDYTVYCSCKRNNVNILFEHLTTSAPFELSRVVVKTPSVGYSSPVREGLIYVSMLPINLKDTENFDRQDKDESTSLFDQLGINCREGRRGSTFGLFSRKDENPRTPNPQTTDNEPIIPKWGSAASRKRKESDPLAKFQIARRSHSVELTFDPPVTGRYILMKLFNNFSEEPQERESTPGPRVIVTESPPREIDIRPQFYYPFRGDDPPPVGDPLRFDTIDDEFEEQDEFFPDDQDGEDEHENVDVQAILFYGHTGRRCFPTVKAL